MMIERKKQIFHESNEIKSNEIALDFVILNGQADSKIDRPTNRPTDQPHRCVRTHIIKKHN